MNTSSETRSCQNCKADFKIDPQDFAFYEKMEVPPPTFCPTCRFQRRLMFRNERVLSKRNCDLCGVSMVSIYSQDNPQKVFCNKCWWSDSWNINDYAVDYDPSRNFFEQFDELRRKTPLPNLVVQHTTMVNSDYVNHAGYLKNCYLVFDAGYSENVLYARTAIAVKDSMDFTVMGESELSYGNVMCGQSSRLFFSYDSAECLNVWFSRALIGCTDCFGCSNLKNKKYHIFNQPYSKEEYEKKIVDYSLHTHQGFERAKKEAEEFLRTIPERENHSSIQNEGTSGEYVYTSKNAKDIYIGRNLEDSRYCQLMTLQPIKDCYDFTEWGENASRIYESITVGEGASDIKFSWACWKPNSMNIEYSMFCISSQDLFGCIGVRKGSYRILNKAYTKEEYELLREKIVADLKANPYVDGKGRVFSYGEFFPYDLSPFAYNESTAVQSFLFPLSKEEAVERGWKWKDIKMGEYRPTVKAADLPDSIHDSSDSIVGELIECTSCTKPYRIVSQELELLRKMNLPLPRMCPECRYEERNRIVNPPVLRGAQCGCVGLRSRNGRYENNSSHEHGDSSCGVSFESPYPENYRGIVYCRSCWDAEFV